jgi:hypothetical protein
MREERERERERQGGEGQKEKKGQRETVKRVRGVERGREVGSEGKGARD